MNYDLAKLNRLNGKFHFTQKDWQFELDGMDDEPAIYQSKRPEPSAPPRKPTIVDRSFEPSREAVQPL